VSALELRDHGKDLLLELCASGDAELEVWAAQRHVAPFEELMQKPVRLALQQQPVSTELAQRRRLPAHR
jgi:hypothetical protein